MAKQTDQKPANAPPPDTKVPKHRSPNHPTIGLEASLAKAKTIYDQFKQHAVPVKAATEAIGYKAGSSSGMQAIASLAYFGLLEIAGSGDKRQAKVTAEGAKIIGNHSDRLRLLREAALKPAIHQELWEKFYDAANGLAPDASINQYLRWDREDGTFNPESVESFIEQFKGSVGFANLISSDTLSDEKADSGLEEQPVVLQPEIQSPKGTQPGVREFTFPLMDGSAVLRVPHPMGEENYNLLKAILDATKVALIGPKKSDAATEPPGPYSDEHVVRRKRLSDP
ncbi:MAG: hypothetical protein AB7K52_04325 [Phycisphaerales bacterium]